MLLEYAKLMDWVKEVFLRHTEIHLATFVFLNILAMTVAESVWAQYWNYLLSDPLRKSVTLPDVGEWRKQQEADQSPVEIQTEQNCTHTHTFNICQWLQDITC